MGVTIASGTWRPQYAHWTDAEMQNSLYLEEYGVTAAEYAICHNEEAKYYTRLEQSGISREDDEARFILEHSRKRRRA